MERAEEMSCRRILEVHILTPLSPSDEKNDAFLRKFSRYHCVALIIVCHSFRFIFTLGVLLLWNLKETRKYCNRLPRIFSPQGQGAPGS